MVAAQHFWILTLCQTLNSALDLHFLLCFSKASHMVLFSHPLYKWGVQCSVCDSPGFEPHLSALRSVCFSMYPMPTPKFQKMLLLYLNAFFFEIFIIKSIWKWADEFIVLSNVDSFSHLFWSHPSIRNQAAWTGSGWKTVRPWDPCSERARSLV